MDVFPVFIDSRPAYLQDGSPGTSLLLTPVGAGTLLDYLLSIVSRASGGHVTVAPTFEPSREYEEAIRKIVRGACHVVPLARFRQHVASYESSDLLLAIDPRCFPVGKLDWERLLDRNEDLSHATHILPHESNPEMETERVHLDEANRVRRIERCYAGVTWLQASGIACSLVPVGAVLLATNGELQSPWDLRQQFISAGVPSRDVALGGGSIDLTEESGLIRLAERLIPETASQAPRQLRTLAGDVYVGSRCTIDKTARIYGPVIVQNDVTIEPEVVVVGPAVLGSGCRIERNSVVAQCLVCQGVVVPRETTVSHRVLSGSLSSCHQANADRADGPSVDHDGMHVPAAETFQLITGAEGRGQRTYRLVKRVVDATVALLGIVASLPLLLVTSLLIKLGSRGPVLFAHEREGMDGKVFRCLKFRTMVDGAHAQQRALYAQSVVDGPQFECPGDPRITPLGRWLRRTNLDELPQLVNVLLGQMSLIGPRPSPFRENQICVAWRRARLSVRPGITGLWQICRRARSSSDFDQWIYYDTLYVRHLSFGIDLKILLATLLTMGGRWPVPLSWIIRDPEPREFAELPGAPSRAGMGGIPEPMAV